VHIMRFPAWLKLYRGLLGFRCCCCRAAKPAVSQCWLRATGLCRMVLGQRAVVAVGKRAGAMSFSKDVPPQHRCTHRVGTAFVNARRATIL
jgi:hypothetical protein